MTGLLLRYRSLSAEMAHVLATDDAVLRVVLVHDHRFYPRVQIHPVRLVEHVGRLLLLLLLTPAPVTLLLLLLLTVHVVR